MKPSSPKVKSCKDCEPGSKRPLVEGSGGRCATHWREEKARRKAAAHDKRVQKVYGLAEGDYESIYQFQGSRCALCLRATGTGRRKLAVDHDHVTGYVRGLLCSTCNQILGHARDDVRFFIRCIGYLEAPPAIAFLKSTTTEDER